MSHKVSGAAMIAVGVTRRVDHPHGSHWCYQAGCRCKRCQAGQAKWAKRQQAKLNRRRSSHESDGSAT